MTTDKIRDADSGASDSTDKLGRLLSGVPQSAKAYAALMLGVRTADDAAELLACIWTAATLRTRRDKPVEEQLRALLREVSAQRWECANEDGDCPDCGREAGEQHDAGCILGMVDAAAFDEPNLNSTTDAAA